MRASSAQNIVANYLGTGYSALVQIAFVPLYIKYLGIEAYGLIGFYASLQTVMSLMDMGLTPTIIREMARHTAGAYPADQARTLLRTIELVYVALATLMLIFIAAASKWLASSWLHATTLSAVDVGRAIVLMGVLISLRWLTGLYRGAILGLQRQIWLNWENVAFSTLRAVGIILVLRWVASTIAIFFAYQACVALLEMLVLMWKSWRLLPAANKPRFSVDVLRDVWRFSAGITIITGLSLLLMQTDKAVLSRMLSLRNFGYYMLASSVAGALLSLVGPLNNVQYPRFTEMAMGNDQQALSQVYHRFSQAICLILVPAGLLLSTFSNPILLLWTRSATTAAAAAPLVSLLALGYTLNGLTHTPYNLQFAYGWIRFAIVTNVVLVIAFVPALYFGVSAHGAIAAAYIWVALNACYLVFTLPIMHRRLLRGELASWYVVDIFLPTSAAYAALAVIRLLVPATAFHALGTGLTVIGLAYMGALFAATVASPLGRSILWRIYGYARRLTHQLAY